VIRECSTFDTRAKKKNTDEEKIQLKVFAKTQPSKYVQHIATATLQEHNANAIMYLHNIPMFERIQPPGKWGVWRQAS
jgi:hypothetical protein